MALTVYGSPYVDGTDLVANWPAASLTVAQSIDSAGYYIGRGNNTQTGSYTAVLTDAGKTITMSNASANTVTIPANASVAYVIGTRISILNLGAGACTPTAGAGVTINGTITALATNGSAALVKTATNTWSYIPSGAGGKILQVVRGTVAATVATTSATYVTTGLNATITPSSASSRVFAIAVFNMTNSGSGDWVDVTLFRGTVAGTNIGPSLGVLNNTVPMTLSQLDSPSTTSAQIYTVGFKARSSVTATFNTLGYTANMILMEVAA